ncbi:MAG: asparaginase domain-containing protein, partial [Blastocatellia bacterium]
MKPRLATFFTGGTISMRIDPATGGAIPALSGEEIIAQVPGLNDIADYDLINFDRLPGPHWTPQRMMELARAIREKLEGKSIDGAVVTHGTDTLEETAYFLDLVLKTDKPVVLIG